VNDKYFFIGFLRAVFCINKEGAIVGKIISDENLDFFTADKEGNIVTFSSDNIKYFNVKGQALASYKLESTPTGHFLNIGEYIYVASVNQLYIYNINEIKSNKNVNKVIVPLSNIPFKDPYLSSITSRNTVWFPYMTRDQILLLDKKTNKAIKTMKFSKKSFAPSDEEVEFEEGNPNFTIIADDADSYYIISMKNKILEVHRISAL
jgi:hypothetical protein